MRGSDVEFVRPYAGDKKEDRQRIAQSVKNGQRQTSRDPTHRTYAMEDRSVGGSLAFPVQIDVEVPTWLEKWDRRRSAWSVSCR